MIKWLGFLFKEKNFYTSLFLIIIHQGLVAMSIYFLTKITGDVINGVQDKENLILLFCAYLVCVYLPYLVGGVANYFSSLWGMNLIYKALKIYNPVFYGKIGLFYERKIKKEVDTIYGSRIITILEDTTSSIHDAISLLINSAFSIFVISILINKWLAFSCTISLITCIIFIKLSNRITQNASFSFEKATIEFSSFLSNFWNNIVSSNRYIETTWKSEQNNLYAFFRNKGKSYSKTTQIYNFLLSSIIILPTLLVIAWLLISNVSNAKFLSELLVNTTRIFSILGSLTILAYYAVEFSGLKGRLEVINNTLILPDNINLEKRIDYDRIFIKNENGDSISGRENIKNFIKKIPSSGRYTITGDNGVGKSTLLLMIKEAYIEDSFFYPTHVDMLISNRHADCSTGQKISSDMECIFNETNCSMFLLDEWDANLSTQNINKISEKLDLISLNKIIIDIRHER